MATIYDPVGECIYCGAREYEPNKENKLAREHIIPFAVNGDLILPESSCRECERITGRIESKALSNHLAGPRSHLGLRGRTKVKDAKKELAIFIPENGRPDRKVMVSVEDYPAALFLLQLDNPPLLEKLRGNMGAGGKVLGGFQKIFNYKPDILQEKYGVTSWATPSLDLFIWCRMLSKIAHSYAVAELGMAGFFPLLQGAIADKDLNSQKSLRFVGGTAPEPAEKALHSISCGSTNVAGHEFVVVKIRLFAQFGAPTYLVVAGTKGKPLSSPT